MVYSKACSRCDTDERVPGGAGTGFTGEISRGKAVVQGARALHLSSGRRSML